MAIIDTLPALTTPTTGDEMPIERGTTVYKIDYNQLAAAILAQCATGVKGNAESSYRKGNVNLTPENLGAFGQNSLGTITNANNTSLYGVGFYQGSVVSNLPSSSSGAYFELVCMGTCQMAYQFSSDGVSAVYSRYYTNNQWYSWVRIDAVNKDSWTELSNTTKGLTVYVKINNLVPRLARIRIRGTASEALSTSSGYASLGTFTALASIVSTEYLCYVFFNGTTHGQLVVGTGGEIKIGYTKTTSTGSAIDFPSGASPFIDVAIVGK